MTLWAVFSRGLMMKIYVFLIVKPERYNIFIENHTIRVITSVAIVQSDREVSAMTTGNQCISGGAWCSN